MRDTDDVLDIERDADFSPAGWAQVTKERGKRA